MAHKVEIRAPGGTDSGRILSRQALEFFAALHAEFNPRRQALLEERKKRRSQAKKFLPETQEIREADWSVAAPPPDLEKRWVEITGPVERKMMINALNSGADVFMADFEDSLAPTWENVVQGQVNLADAVRRTIEYVAPEGKRYRLGDQTATLCVRPRGWHLQENHALIAGRPVSASLFDFALYLFHNGAELGKRGTGPYFYLPKMESHREARLWNDVFVWSQQALSLPRGTIRATVLIETFPAAFEMQEILYELREHSSGLNAGRWDYIFSIVKHFGQRADVLLPDRAQITMTVPFMRAYTELLVQTCHRRKAHAIGGMAAFIPSRRDEEINRTALAAVRADKQREVKDGFDGSWVAHPDLVAVVREVFAGALGNKPHQVERTRDDVRVNGADLSAIQVAGGQITEHGLRNNVSVALQYLSSWLSGQGAAAIFNLMEDTATAEISRAQLWQWVHRRANLADGREINTDLYRAVRDQELEALGGRRGAHYAAAADLLDRLVLSSEFCDFLTLLAYEKLD